MTIEVIGLGPLLTTFVGHQCGQILQVHIVAVSGADQCVVAHIIVAAHQAVDDCHIIVIAVPGWYFIKAMSEWWSWLPGQGSRMIGAT